MDVGDLRREEHFDAVFSNATLHWVLEKEKAVRSMTAQLKAGGRIVLEFGGKGNIQTISGQIRKTLADQGYPDQAARELWYFPSISEYTSLLDQHGLEVTYAQLYDRPTPLSDPESGIIDWIKMFGSAFFEDIEDQERQHLIPEIQEQLRPACYRDGRWWADYRRIQVIAKKVP